MCQAWRAGGQHIRRVNEDYVGVRVVCRDKYSVYVAGGYLPIYASFNSPS